MSTNLLDGLSVTYGRTVEVQHPNTGRPVLGTVKSAWLVSFLPGFHKDRTHTAFARVQLEGSSQTIVVRAAEVAD